ncbi:MAG: methyltransferase domain-containing protein [Patescibacteria group bacterium]
MKYTGNNSQEYWDDSWTRGIKKFPKHTMQRIFNLIPNKVSVLDIGSGSGNFLYDLKEKKNCEVYGIDISQVAIDKGKEKGVDGEVRSAEEMDNFTREFDVVVCSHLLEHIGDDKNLVKNINKTTKQFAIIAVPNDCSFPEFTSEHVRKYTAKSLKELLIRHFPRIEDHTGYNRKTLKNHLIFKCLK